MLSSKNLLYTQICEHNKGEGEDVEKNKYIRICIAVFFFLLIITAYIFRIDKKISLTFLQEHHQRIQEFITQNYFLSLMGYIILYIAFIIVMLPITILFNIASGYFFGVVLGTVYSVIGCVIGSLASFLIFRYILRDWATKRYHKRLIHVEQEFDKHGAWYILSLQLFPITPFAIINTIAGLSHIPAWKFMGISCIGVTPYIFLNAFAGRKLVEIRTLKDVLSPWFIGIFVGLSLCALAPTLIQYIKTKLKKQ